MCCYHDTTLFLHRAQAADAQAAAAESSMAGAGDVGEWMGVDPGGRATEGVSA